VFIDIYTTKTFKGDYRIGYLRLNVRDCLGKKNKPTWFRLKSPYNEQGGKRVGSLMASVQLMHDD
jgi:hypothetical protein